MCKTVQHLSFAGDSHHIFLMLFNISSLEIGLLFFILCGLQVIYWVIEILSDYEESVVRFKICKNLKMTIYSRIKT